MPESMNGGSPADSPREVFERAQLLLRDRDMNGFADLWAADGVMEFPFAVPGVLSRFTGRAQIRAHLAATSHAVPVRIDEFRNVVVHETTDPEVVIAEFDTRGTVVATGHRYEMPFIQVIRVRHGKIVLFRDYWNPLAWAQLADGLPEFLSMLNGDSEPAQPADHRGDER